MAESLRKRIQVGRQDWSPGCTSETVGSGVRRPTRTRSQGATDGVFKYPGVLKFGSQGRGSSRILIRLDFHFGRVI